MNEVNQNYMKQAEDYGWSEGARFIKWGAENYKLKDSIDRFTNEYEAGEALAAQRLASLYNPEQLGLSGDEVQDKYSESMKRSLMVEMRDVHFNKTYLPLIRQGVPAADAWKQTQAKMDEDLRVLSSWSEDADEQTKLAFIRKIGQYSALSSEGRGGYLDEDGRFMPTVMDDGVIAGGKKAQFAAIALEHSMFSLPMHFILGKGSHGTGVLEAKALRQNARQINERILGGGAAKAAGVASFALPLAEMAAMFLVPGGNAGKAGALTRSLKSMIHPSRRGMIYAGIKNAYTDMTHYSRYSGAWNYFTGDDERDSRAMEFAASRVFDLATYQVSMAVTGQLASKGAQAAALRLNRPHTAWGFMMEPLMNTGLDTAFDVAVDWGTHHAASALMNPLGLGFTMAQGSQFGDIEGIGRDVMMRLGMRFGMGVLRGGAGGDYGPRTAQFWKDMPGEHGKNWFTRLGLKAVALSHKRLPTNFAEVVRTYDELGQKYGTPQTFVDMYKNNAIDRKAYMTQYFMQERATNAFFNDMFDGLSLNPLKLFSSLAGEVGKWGFDDVATGMDMRFSSDAARDLGFVLADRVHLKGDADESNYEAIANREVDYILGRSVTGPDDNPIFNPDVAEDAVQRLRSVYAHIATSDDNATHRLNDARERVFVRRANELPDTHRDAARELDRFARELMAGVTKDADDDALLKSLHEDDIAAIVDNVISGNSAAERYYVTLHGDKVTNPIDRIKLARETMHTDIDRAQANPNINQDSAVFRIAVTLGDELDRLFTRDNIQPTDLVDLRRHVIRFTNLQLNARLDALDRLLSRPQNEVSDDIKLARLYNTLPEMMMLNSTFGYRHTLDTQKRFDDFIDRHADIINKVDFKQTIFASDATIREIFDGVDLKGLLAARGIKENAKPAEVLREVMVTIPEITRYRRHRLAVHTAAMNRKQSAWNRVWHSIVSREGDEYLALDETLYPTREEASNASAQGAIDAHFATAPAFGAFSNVAYDNYRINYTMSRSDGSHNNKVMRTGDIANVIENVGAIGFTDVVNGSRGVGPESDFAGREQVEDALVVAVHKLVVQDRVEHGGRPDSQRVQSALRSRRLLGDGTPLESVTVRDDGSFTMRINDEYIDDNPGRTLHEVYDIFGGYADIQYRPNRTQSQLRADTGTYEYKNKVYTPNDLLDTVNRQSDYNLGEAVRMMVEMSPNFERAARAVTNHLESYQHKLFEDLGPDATESFARTLVDRYIHENYETVFTSINSRLAKKSDMYTTGPTASVDKVYGDVSGAVVLDISLEGFDRDANALKELSKMLEEENIIVLTHSGAGQQMKAVRWDKRSGKGKHVTKTEEAKAWIDMLVKQFDYWEPKHYGVHTQSHNSYMQGLRELIEDADVYRQFQSRAEDVGIKSAIQWFMKGSDDGQWRGAVNMYEESLVTRYRAFTERLLDLVGGDEAARDKLVEFVRKNTKLSVDVEDTDIALPELQIRNLTSIIELFDKLKTGGIADIEAVAGTSRQLIEEAFGNGADQRLLSNLELVRNAGNLESVMNEIAEIQGGIVRELDIARERYHEQVSSKNAIAGLIDQIGLTAEQSDPEVRGELIDKLSEMGNTVINHYVVDLAERIDQLRRNKSAFTNLIDDDDARRKMMMFLTYGPKVMTLSENELSKRAGSYGNLGSFIKPDGELDDEVASVINGKSYNIMIINSSEVEGKSVGDGGVWFPRPLLNAMSTRFGIDHGASKLVYNTPLGSIKIQAETTQDMIGKQMIGQNGGMFSVDENTIILTTDAMKNIDDEFMEAIGLSPNRLADIVYQKNGAQAYVGNINHRDMKQFMRHMGVHAPALSRAQETSVGMQPSDLTPIMSVIHRSIAGKMMNQSRKELGKISFTGSVREMMNRIQAAFRKPLDLEGAHVKAFYLDRNMDESRGNVNLITPEQLSSGSRGGYNPYHGVLSFDLITDLVRRQVNKAQHERKHEAQRILTRLNEIQSRADEVSFDDASQAEIRAATIEALDYLSNWSEGIIFKDGDDYMFTGNRSPNAAFGQSLPLVLAGVRRTGVHTGVEMSTYAMQIIQGGDYDGDSVSILPIPKEEWSDMFKTAYGRDEPFRETLGRIWNEAIRRRKYAGSLGLKFERKAVDYSPEKMYEHKYATGQAIKAITAATSLTSQYSGRSLSLDKESLKGKLNIQIPDHVEAITDIVKFRPFEMDSTERIGPDGTMKLSLIEFDDDIAKGRFHGAHSIEGMSSERRGYTVYQVRGNDETSWILCHNDRNNLGYKKMAIVTTNRLFDSDQSERALSGFLGRMGDDTTNAGKRFCEVTAGVLGIPKDSEDVTIDSYDVSDKHRRVGTMDGIASQIMGAGTDEAKHNSVDLLLDKFGGKLYEGVRDFYTKMVVASNMIVGKSYEGTANLVKNTVPTYEAKSETTNREIIKSTGQMTPQLIENIAEKMKTGVDGKHLSQNDVNVLMSLTSNAPLKPAEFAKVRAVAKKYRGRLNHASSGMYFSPYLYRAISQMAAADEKLTNMFNSSPVARLVSDVPDDSSIASVALGDVVEIDGIGAFDPNQAAYDMNRMLQLFESLHDASGMKSARDDYAKRLNGGVPITFEGQFDNGDLAATVHRHLTENLKFNESGYTVSTPVTLGMVKSALADLGMHTSYEARPAIEHLYEAMLSARSKHGGGIVGNIEADKNVRDLAPHAVRKVTVAKDRKSGKDMTINAFVRLAEKYIASAPTEPHRRARQAIYTSIMALMNDTPQVYTYMRANGITGEFMSVMGKYVGDTHRFRYDDFIDGANAMLNGKAKLPTFDPNYFGSNIREKLDKATDYANSDFMGC